jgi:hypothetical protein
MSFFLLKKPKQSYLNFTFTRLFHAHKWQIRVYQFGYTVGFMTWVCAVPECRAIRDEVVELAPNCERRNGGGLWCGKNNL